MNKSIEDMGLEEMKETVKQVRFDIADIYQRKVPGTEVRPKVSVSSMGNDVIPQDETAQIRLHLKYLDTALKKPQELQGCCEISVNQEIVYQVMFGEVVEDKLNLKQHFEQKELMEEILENYTQGIEVARNVARFTEIYTQGEGEKESEYYNFSLKNGEFKVVAVDENRTVLTDKGFTAYTSEEDREFFLKLSEAAKQFQDYDQEQDQNHNQEYDLKPKI